MSNLLETFLGLTAEQKRLVHLELCQNALTILDNYLNQTDEISYVEWIVETTQHFDKTLPRDAFEAVKSDSDLINIDFRYSEPISALHDEFLEFPDNIEFAYYAIYNLYSKYRLNRDIDDWLICNQALSAETDSEKWQDLLNDAILKSL